jgi:hypothetical protein
MCDFCQQPLQVGKIEAISGDANFNSPGSCFVTGTHCWHKGTAERCCHCGNYKEEHHGPYFPY